MSDTDAGALDGDTVNDRVVGPLLIAPSHWTSVSVDADDDGVRDPQDIDDASLAVGVLLCSTGHNTATDDGARAALAVLNADKNFAPLALEARAKLSDAQQPNGSNTPTAIPINAVSSSARPSQAEPSAIATAQAHRYWTEVFSVRSFDPWPPVPGATPSPFPTTTPTATPWPSGSPTPCATATTTEETPATAAPSPVVEVSPTGTPSVTPDNDASGEPVDRGSTPPCAGGGSELTSSEASVD